MSILYPLFYDLIFVNFLCIDITELKDADNNFKGEEEEGVTHLSLLWV